MKVLLLNGSAKAAGCTFTALSVIAQTLQDEGVETEILHLGTEPVRDCIGCLKCRELGGQCVFADDIVNRIIEKAKTCDGFVLGTPVYYAHPSGRVLSVLDRVFYAGGANFTHKPGMAIASARRAGTTASCDVLNKYFTIAQMPVVSSTYWNMVHGSAPDDVMQDLEGLQTMRNLAHNMAWMLRCFALGRENGVLPPQNEKTYRTNFIR